MKKLIGVLLLLLFYLLAFPAHALESARSGLLLWYRSVLPVLLPFMLISGILMRFDLLKHILPVISRPFHFLFGCSKYGTFAILTGFFCGFPIGAKVTADLHRQGKISQEEAYVLYGFVNNLSPAFILSFIAADQMQLASWGGLFLLNILGSAVIYGLISSRRLRRITDQTTNSELPLTNTSTSHDLYSSFAIIDECIYDSIQSAVRLGAYIMMFSLLCGAVSLLLPARDPFTLSLTSCIEVSNGIHLIAGSSLPLLVRYLMVSILGAFGGLSALAQTLSIASMDHKLSVHYIKSRVMITLLSALITVCSILFFCFFNGLLN